MTKRILFSLASLLMVGLSAQAKPGGESNAVTHGPYLCDMKDDGVTIVWTSKLPSVSWVEVAPADDGHFYKTERPRYFQTKHGRKLINRTLHTIRVDGLKPGTTYRYRVFSDQTEHWPNSYMVRYGKRTSTPAGDRNRFTTFTNDRKDVSFLVLNDIHGRADFMAELCKNVDFDTFDFVALNGDMSTIVTSEESLFKDYIDTCASLFGARVPVMFNRGNHETRGRFADRLPDYFPTEDGRFYQVYYQGGVCFLVLDCGEDKPDSDVEYSGTADYDAYRERQARWLERVVNTDRFRNARARIVLLHIPPTVGDWHGNDHLRQTVMPILNKAGIDLMLSGHTHRYSFHPADGETAFPILVNGNSTYAQCTVDDRTISVDVKGQNASEDKRHKFPLKQATPAQP